MIDLPSTLATIPLAFFVDPLLNFLCVGLFTGSFIGAGLFLFAGTLEWLAIGKLLQGWLERRQSDIWVLQKLNRYCAPAIVIIVLFTIIATPMVNKRSRQLGFRHGGISFFDW